MAETIALQAVSFIINNETLCTRFISLTGSDQTFIKDNITNALFLANVLDFLLAHEPDLLDFCDTHALQPNLPIIAKRTLMGLVNEVT